MATIQAQVVCRSCRHMLQLAPTQLRWSSSACTTRSRPQTQLTKRIASTASRRHQVTAAATSKQTAQAVNLAAIHARVDELSKRILTNPGVPDEATTSKTLQEYEQMARQLLATREAAAEPVQAKTDSSSTATSALLSAVNKKNAPKTITKADVLARISTHAHAIVEHEPVFITASILRTYITLQSLLGAPSSFPDTFGAYRSKPIPRPASTAPITYTHPNPDKPSAAVAPAVADAALDAALTAHDLPLALAVIDTTYCTTANKRSKFLRSALFPIAGAVLTPAVAYTLAMRFSDMQNTMDPSMATGIAMAGILTYTSAVATVGYVALTTANDQMQRVTWAIGMPLWERWVREEERAAVDRVALAWGFKSKDRWGEEEGGEWEELKEWIGLRGMVLDRVELMEGME